MSDRAGLYGRFIDGAQGRELDRVGKVFGVQRMPARVFGRKLPWGQMDETYRRRIWDVIQRMPRYAPLEMVGERACEVVK